jgi:hypothetical protein
MQKESNSNVKLVQDLGLSPVLNTNCDNCANDSKGLMFQLTVCTFKCQPNDKGGTHFILKPDTPHIG